MLNLNSGFRSLAIGSVLTMAMGALASPDSPTSQKNSPSDPSLQKRMMRHEAKFYENKGQWDNRGQFLTRRPGLDMWFEDRGIDFVYYQTGGSHNHPTRKGQSVAMRFVGKGSNVKFEGVKVTGSVNDYLLSKKWVRGVRGYTEVRSNNVYPGIDFRGYYEGDKPRYDFIVSPHANPTSIAMKYDGAQKIAVTDSGVQITTQIGDRLQGDLHAYQNIGGHRISVPAAFKLVAKNEVRLSVGSYDKSQPLVIDPLVYGTYFGGDGGWDEVRSVVSDSTTSGGVYLTGDTQSALFPVTAGPFFLNLKGIQNAFIARLQGDAFNEDYSAFVGGSIVDSGQFLKIDPHGNVLMAGSSTSSDFPGSTRDNKILLTGDPTATGGQFVLTNGFSLSQPLPFNATVAQVTTALSQIGLASSLDPRSPPSNPGGIPLQGGGSFEFDFVPSAAGFPFSVISTRIGDNTGEFSSGLPFIVVNYFQTDQNGNTLVNNLTPEASAATAGSFTLSFTATPGGTPSVTKPISLGATSVQIQAALQALGNIGSLTAVVTDAGPGFTSAPSEGIMATDIMQVSFALKGVVQPEIPLTINPIGWEPVPSYSVNLFPYIWAFAFQPVGNLLTPIANCELSFGNAFGTELDGFDVKQVPNAAKTLPDDLVFSGNTSWNIPEFPAIPYNVNTNGTQKGYMVRMGFNPFGASGNNYSLTTNASNYITSTFPVANRGVVLDASGSAYTVGTVFGQGNTDTSINPVFPTTPGVFANGTFSDPTNGRLLRNADIFVQKYTANTNAISWSGLLGGHANDYAGGWFYDLDGSDVATGSAIALDPSGSVYVTGLAQSYDFPRTRGVYGENFTDGDAVTVTKISNDGSNVIYSTNLNSSGLYISAGIGIDELGDAVVTGNTVPLETFPENIGQMPGDPDQPTSTFYGIIGTTSDAFAGTFGGPTAPAIGTISAWVNVISPDATTLVYGSYLGGVLNNRVYAPYLDNFGDLWLFGWVETFRAYSVFSSTGTATNYLEDAGLPQSMISSNAFKDYPDNGDSTEDFDVAYGFWDAYGFTVAPLFIPTSSNRDGWVVKLRIGLPSIQTLSFNPATVPGGFGSTSTGTVTLSAPAPSNGAVVNLSILSGSGASFSSTSQLGTSSITIPGGGTSGTFTVYTSPVSAVTPVTFTANYLGSFQNAVLNVEPYLGGFTITPSAVVGGTQATGTITLVQPAPAGGVSVTLSSSSNRVILPTGPVVVPAGQTTASVAIGTHGIPKTIQVTVSAAVNSFSITAPLQITPATLATLVFNPNSIPDGTSSKGTVTLNGTAGTNLTVTVVGAGGGALPNGVTVSPSSFTIFTGQTSGTFTVNIPPTTVNPLTSLTLLAKMGSTQGSITNYPASQVSGSLQITPTTIGGFTLSPSSLTAGAVATGTVTLANPAPASGLTLNVTSSPSGVVTFYQGTLSSTNPATNTLAITIPSGGTTATFSVLGGFVTTTTSTKVTVTKPGQSMSQTVTVTPPTLSLTLNPQEVVGGVSSQGILSIPAPTPKTLTFTLKETAAPSSSGTGSLPSTVTIAAGQTASAPFTIGTKPVAVPTTLTITASDGGYSVTQQLFVDEVGIASVTFSPAAIHAPIQTTTCTVTLTGPAPTGGVVIQLLPQSGTGYLKLPSTVTVPAGMTSVSVSVSAQEVSRNVSESVTAQLADGSSSAAGVVTVMVP